LIGSISPANQFSFIVQKLVCVTRPDFNLVVLCPSFLLLSNLREDVMAFVDELEARDRLVDREANFDFSISHRVGLDEATHLTEENEWSNHQSEEDESENPAQDPVVDDDFSSEDLLSDVVFVVPLGHVKLNVIAEELEVLEVVQSSLAEVEVEQAADFDSEWDRHVRRCQLRTRHVALQQANAACGSRQREAPAQLLRGIVEVQDPEAIVANEHERAVEVETTVVVTQFTITAIRRAVEFHVSCNWQAPEDL
jgi:hypothetical protein